jgi:HD superfamily phosphodiesterase
MNTPEIAETWSKPFAELLGHNTLADAAHDPGHIRRVVTNARRLALAEGGA